MAKRSVAGQVAVDKSLQPLGSEAWYRVHRHGRTNLMICRDLAGLAGRRELLDAANVLDVREGAEVPVSLGDAAAGSLFRSSQRLGSPPMLFGQAPMLLGSLAMHVSRVHRIRPADGPPPLTRGYGVADRHAYLRTLLELRPVCVRKPGLVVRRMLMLRLAHVVRTCSRGVTTGGSGRDRHEGDDSLEGAHTICFLAAEVVHLL